MGRQTKEQAEKTKQRIQTLTQQGELSLAEIARALNVSRQYISLVLKSESGIAEPPRRDVSGLIRSIQKLSGFSITKIAEIIGANRVNVSQWRNGHHKASHRYATRLERLAEELKLKG